MSKKRLYEGMFLIDSNLVTKDWSVIETHITDILTRGKAEILYSERWPDRKLAFDIKGCKKGTHYLTYFNCEPEALTEINRDIRLSERILRHLIIQEAGLDREMERRKNREITAPPAELTFGEDRFETREFGGGGFRGRRGDAPVSVAVDPAVPAEEAPGGV